MKKILNLICIATIVFSIIGTVPALATDGLLGDVSGDNRLDIIDVVYTRSYIVGNAKFSANQFASADMNGDKTVDIVDVVKMRNEIVNNGGSDADESGFSLSTKNLNIEKGSCALIYVTTNYTEQLKIDYNSDYFEAQIGKDDKSGILAIAVFAHKNATSAVSGNIEVYLEGNEFNRKTIVVTVSDSTDFSTYVNHPKVPDFGVYCGLTPANISIDGTHYAYSVSELRQLYGDNKTLEYYKGFTDVLESYGFTERRIETNSNGGETIFYASADGKIGIEYGSLNTVEVGEMIVININEIK